MGLNAVLTYGIVFGMHLSWQIAMALIFIEGLVIYYPSDHKSARIGHELHTPLLKISIGVAIGVFIAFLGFKDSGLMVANPDTFLAFGSMANPAVITSLIGLIIIMVFMALKLKGSILYGIVLTSFIAIALCFVGNSIGIAFNMYSNSGSSSHGRYGSTGGAD